MSPHPSPNAQKEILDLQRDIAQQRIFFYFYIVGHPDGHLLFHQILGESLFYMVKDLRKTYVLMELVLDLHPSEEIGHGFGGKVVSKVDGDHNADWPFHLFWIHILVDGFHENSRHIFSDGNLIGAGFL